MPRDGSGNYTLPPGTDGIPNTTILSTAYNTFIHDIGNDQNTPRPIVAGGTGATTPSAAMTNLGGVPSTGGTMTGNLAIHPASGDATLWLEKSVPTAQNTIYGAYGGHARWAVTLGDNQAETGGNVGSNFGIAAYADTGSFLGFPIQITRSSFLTTFNGDATFNHYVRINDAGGPTLFLDNLNSGNQPGINLAKNGAIQWRVSAAGDFSSFNIGRFNSSGAFVDIPLQIDLATGSSTFSHSVNCLDAMQCKQFMTVVGGPNSILSLNKTASGAGNIISGKTNSLEKWRLYLGDFAGESGSNNGSDFTVERYNDSGGAIDQPFTINRASGTAAFKQAVQITSTDPTLSLNALGSGHARTILGTNNFTGRWFMQLGDNTNEGGSNTGSNFVIGRQSDSGSFISTPLTIDRNNGAVRINNANNYYGSQFCILSAVSNSPAIEFSGVDRGLIAFNTAATGYPVLFTQGTSGNIVGSISVNSTTTSFNTSSDARRKEDLKPFDGGAVIDAINAYDFLWKGTDRRGHGVLAQEVHEVYPEATDYNAKDDIWGVDYSKFVPLLLAEIKALRARVAALEGR